MQRFYVYRFKNEENEIIYVGKTKDLKQRIRTHFGKQGHLPKECYEEVRKIEFLTFENESLMGIKELYYIAKFQPRYNSKDKSDFLYLGDLEQGDKWEEYLHAKEFVNKVLTKRESELMEENAMLRQQIIDIRKIYERLRREDLEMFKRKYEEKNAIIKKISKWDDEKNRIISAYERKTEWVWCDSRQKLVRNYNK